MKLLNRILLSWLPSTLSIVSVLSDLTLIVFVYGKIRDLKIEAKQEIVDRSRDIIIAKMIGVLAASDIVYDMIRLCNQMPSILYSIHITNSQCFSGDICKVVAFLDQFSSVFDTLAQLVLAFAFLHLLLRSPVPKPQKKRKILNICKQSCSCSIFDDCCCVLSFVLCFLISVGIATIPLFVPFDDWTYGDFFNYTDTYNNTYSCECWILGGFEYFWIILVIAGWVLHCVVLLISWYRFGGCNIISCLYCTCFVKHKKFKNSRSSYRYGYSGISDNVSIIEDDVYDRTSNTSLNTQMLQLRKDSKYISYLLIKSLQPWVICYTITRLPIIFARLWQLWVDNNNKIDTDAVNFSLMVIHNILASIIGIGNLITWICVQKVYKRFQKIYKDRHLSGPKSTPTELRTTRSKLSGYNVDNDDHDHDVDINNNNNTHNDAGPRFSILDNNDFDSAPDKENSPNKPLSWFAASDKSIQRSMKTDPKDKK